MADLLSGIMNSIFGPPTSMMTDKDAQATEAARAKDSSKAQGYAFDASNDPGESFMRPETSVGTGGDLMKTIGKIMKLFGGGGGG